MCPETIAIIGGGPAGLMAAEVLADQGLKVEVFDAMPSLGRKFLMAGRGGLNLTHTEPLAAFHERYGERRRELSACLAAFGPQAVRDWAQALGIATFVGSSGRVFPVGMKAAPLLRAWLAALRERGVVFHVRHRWLGWDGQGALRFATPDGERRMAPRACLLALGGGSWRRLGSDGAWMPWLAARGVALAPLQAANCGFDVAWTPHFIEHFAGQPVKSIALFTIADNGERRYQRGECMIRASGIEGGLIYAHGSELREQLGRRGHAQAYLDLLPDRDAAFVLAALKRSRGARSMSSHLRTRLGLHGVKTGLLRECLDAAAFATPEVLAATIKQLPLRLTATRPMDEAISTAGGVCFTALDANQMLRAVPGVFCAGEMLDWEAPTGGYLLTACFASGHAAGQGMARWLAAQREGSRLV